jgi:head-tail adaptor
VPAAGTLDQRFRFDRRIANAGDGAGNFEEGWAPDFGPVWTKRQYLHGSETVQAARLAGQQPVLLTIRMSSQSRAVSTSHRAVNERTGEIYNITAVNPTADRAFIELLATSGVAAG